MRLAFICDEYYPDTGGGAGISAKLIVDGLRACGHDVDVYALIGEEKRRVDRGDGVFVLPAGDQYLGPGEIGENISLYRHLPDLSDYDLVHVYGIGHLPAVVRRATIPVIGTINNHVWTCIDKERFLRDGCPQLTWRRALLESFTATPSLLGPARYVVSWLGRQLAQRADWFTVQTNGMKDIAAKTGYDPDRISVVPNLLDPAFDMAGQHEDNTILFIGRLVPHKGAVDVATAFTQLDAVIRDGWTLQIYGSGPQQDTIQDLADQLDAGSIEIGYCPYDDLPHKYADAAFVVHASRYPEPFSRTWLEAMGTGAPVLSSDTPSARDVFQDAAVFYDPFDQDSLRKQLTHMIQHGNERQERGNELRKMAAQYRPAHVVEQYVSVYETLLSS